jgi:hypothetical protein
MKLPRMILAGMRDWFGAPPKALLPPARMQVSNVTRQTVLGTQVEVADSGPARSKGLLGRQGLEPGGGLWIVPCESVHTFAMKFPLDLVYLDRNLRIRKVKSGVPPWRLSACLSAHSVLELSAGTISHSQTKAGDKLEFTPVTPESGA